MLALPDLMDFHNVQQHLSAQEIYYRQQIMQRIPDPFAAMLPLPVAQHIFLPAPQPTLPGVEAKLENQQLWQEFHSIGTEMIITKTGRRMFPSMRVSLNGLEDDANYCVLVEMIPIGECRYKYSGTHWVPAGGAEPQSPQRMYLHPDSPATGAHWQAQPLLFSKIKLTNNTLDNNGHIVLASMHKYQPRLHVIRTSDLTQLPWAPQKAFVFPETEFIAVTAYQNDRITKLKIDNNPFAKGFRETGQSRCKRKISTSPVNEQEDDAENNNINNIESDFDVTPLKRMRSNESFATSPLSTVNESTTTTLSSAYATAASASMLHPYMSNMHYLNPYHQHHEQQQVLPNIAQHLLQSQIAYAATSGMLKQTSYMKQILFADEIESQQSATSDEDEHEQEQEPGDIFVDVVSTATDEQQQAAREVTPVLQVKSNNFSISAILGRRDAVVL